MPFQKPNLTTIIARIEADITSRLTGGVALLRYSLLAVLARVFGGAMHTVYGYLDYISKQVLVPTAEGRFLDLLGIMWDRPRIQATLAVGTVTFTGTNDALIPLNTILVRDDGIEFLVTTQAIIASGTATTDVSAIEAGTTGNMPVATTLSLLSPLPDIDDDSEVATGFDEAIDKELDPALRSRILERIKNPPAGGSESDYKQESKKVAGVVNAYAFGDYDGLEFTPGYVTVVILGVPPTYIPPAGVLTDVERALTDSGWKPVTAKITVEPIDPALIDSTIKITPNTSEIQAIIEDNIDVLFQVEGTPGGTILLTHFESAIQAAGVDDYEITVLEVDGSPVSGNIVLTDYEFPVKDTITFQDF